LEEQLFTKAKNMSPSSQEDSIEKKLPNKSQELQSSFVESPQPKGDEEGFSDLKDSRNESTSTVRA